MVEYALLIAGSSLNTLSTLAATVGVYLSRVNWEAVSYLLIALVALRIAMWAFRTPS